MDKARKERHILMTKLLRKPSLYKGRKKKPVILIWESPVVDEGDLVQLFKKDRDQEVENFLQYIFIQKCEKNKNSSSILPQMKKNLGTLRKHPVDVLKLDAEIEPNTVENQNNDESLGEISDYGGKSSNEQSENEEGKLTAPIELLGEIAVLIYEPENTEAKQVFPFPEEKVLMEEAQKHASGESEDDEETSAESSDSNTSTSCSNSNNEENEESSDDSKEN